MFPRLKNILRVAAGSFRRRPDYEQAWKQYISLGEFYTYINDVRAVFEHVRGNMQFTGREAAASLERICESLKPITDEVAKYQTSLTQIIIVEDEGTIADVRQESKISPTSIYLGKERYSSIGGLREGSRNVAYLKAGTFSAYLVDLTQVFNLFYKKGIHFLGETARNRVGVIRLELSTLAGEFNYWQSMAQENIAKRLELRDRDYPTLRKFT